ncbi:hypothetical protein BGX23_009852 [Mortierella sp. AD031]|nr:hypothetical protein BGX23_009852 [Mortierella sp. AD031]
MLTIQNGDFQDVHLKVATVVQAEAHPKVWLKSTEETIKSIAYMFQKQQQPAAQSDAGASGLQRLFSRTVSCRTITILPTSSSSLFNSLLLPFRVNQHRLLDRAPKTMKTTTRIVDVWAISMGDGYDTPQSAGIDNSLLYLNYGPAIRNVRLGRIRDRELSGYLYGIQGHRRIHLTCLAIHGYWSELEKVLEKMRVAAASLKMLAIRSNEHSVSFRKSRVADLFRGNRLVVIHESAEADEEVRM